MKEMTDARCWALIEAGWATYPALDKTRNRAVSLNEAGALQQLAVMLDQVVVPAIGLQLMQLEEVALIDFSRWMEERMFQLDRADLFRYTHASERRFIDARAFIIGMGQRYYDLIDRYPDRAKAQLEVAYVAGLGYQAYQQKMDKSLERFVKYDMRTRSNKQAWVRGAGE